VKGAYVWLEGFAVTLAVEEVIAVPLLAPAERSILRRAMAVLLVNLATHPIVWYVLTRLGWPVLVGDFVAEAWAFGFEIIAYRVIFADAPWLRCALASVAANTGSLLAGLLAARLGMYR
jgi:hypothetical protein